MNKKKWLAIALKLAVSGGLIWYLISSIDLDAASHRLAMVKPFMLFLAAFILLFQMIIAGLRWKAVLRGIEVGLGFWEAVRFFYVGSFFNQALPGGTGGDFVRVYLVYKAQWGLRGALNGVILERVVTVLALVILVISTLPVFFSNLDEGGRAWVVPSVALISVGALFGVILLCLLDKLPSEFSKWKVVRGLFNLASDARAVFLTLRVFFPAVFWSIFGHINVAIAVYVLARGLNLDISVFDSIVLMPPVLLVMTVPISIGAWGVRENAMVIAFGLIGISAEAATVLGLLLGLVGLTVAIPGGLLWLSGRRRTGVSIEDVKTELAVVGSNER